MTRQLQNSKKNRVSSRDMSRFFVNLWFFGVNLSDLIDNRLSIMVSGWTALWNFTWQASKGFDTHVFSDIIDNRLSI